MFKSSHTIAQLADDMNQEGPESPLQGKEAYFEGYHPRCIAYITLALFVYHPAKRYILRFA